MGSRTGGRSVTFNNIDKVQAVLNEISKDQLNVAKGELRQGTKAIANRIVIPALQVGAAGSGVPIAPKLAETARTRTDRVVTVRIGMTNPKLSGFNRKRKNKGSKPRPINSQSQRTTLAYGSDRGPHPSNPQNHYGVGRNARGYWVLPTIASNGTWQAVKAEYQALLYRLLMEYGENR